MKLCHAVPAMLVVLGLLAGLPAQAFGQGEQARLTGRVTDGSGAALPGATVTITPAKQGKPVVVVTDAVGQYQTPPLPAGTYAVSFEMSGFETRTTPAVVLAPGELFVLDRQLGLAQLTETVTVTGEVPKPPPPPAPLPPLRKQPAIVPVPKLLLASVCGPEKPGDEDITVGHIVGHRDEPRRELFGPNDVLLLDVGTDMGMKPGDNYVVRRRFQIGDKSLAFKKQPVYGGQGAGLVQVVDASPESSVAVVVYACAEFFAGDGLVPFEPLPVLTADGAGDPQFDDPAHVVFGELGRATATANQLMVIDRGYSQGVVRGQRITLFRRSAATGGPVIRIGDGVVVAIRPQSATIRIDRSNDAVEAGTLVALHK
jgi:Fe2+ transport system protein FeoA